MEGEEFGILPGILEQKGNDPKLSMGWKPQGITWAWGCFMGTGINPGIGNSHLIPDRICVVLDDFCPLLDTWKEKKRDWDLPRDRDPGMKLRSQLGLSFQGFPQLPASGSGPFPSSQLELNFQKFRGKLLNPSP